MDLAGLSKLANDNGVTGMYPIPQLKITKHELGMPGLAIVRVGWEMPMFVTIARMLEEILNSPPSLWSPMVERLLVIVDIYSITYFGVQRISDFEFFERLQVIIDRNEIFWVQQILDHFECLEVIVERY